MARAKAKTPVLLQPTEPKEKAKPRAKRAPKQPSTMALWDSVCTPDAAYVVPAADRLSVVNPMWRIREATRLWGPQGGRWKVRTTYEVIKVQSVVLYQAVVAEVSVSGPGCKVEDVRAGAWLVGPKDVVSLDAFKSSRTLALSKALSQLGFGADIHLGLFRHPEQDKADAAHEATKPDADAPWVTGNGGGSVYDRPGVQSAKEVRRSRVMEEIEERSPVRFQDKQAAPEFVDVMAEEAAL